MKKVLYIDMDNVLVDFDSWINQLEDSIKKEYEGKLDEVPNIFSLMKPIDWALESYEILSKHFEMYILSTAPWENPSAWYDKINWVKKYLNEFAYKKLILSHNKNLNKWDFIIDDRTKNGVDKFEGEHIHFWTDKFPDWKSVTEYLLKRT